MGHFGFSYIGLVFLLALFIPNIIWAGKRPQGYTTEKENKVLLIFERTGEILTTICVLVFNDLQFPWLVKLDLVADHRFGVDGDV